MIPLPGLPQEVNITRTALSRGWAVLAVSSAEREHRCWRPSPPQAAPSQDTLNVRARPGVLGLSRSNTLELQVAYV
eukprot:1161393-Pelagomonas_calceolata.AAC.3